MKKRLFIASYCYVLFNACFAVTIEQAAQQAILKNPQVLQAMRAYQASTEDYKAAFAGYLPKLDVTGNIGYEHARSPNNQTQVDKDESAKYLLRRQVRAEARQVLFDSQATSSNIRRQKSNMEANSWHVASVVNEVSLQLTSAYINVIRNRALVDAAKANVRVHKKIANMLLKRSASGVGKSTDSVQADGRLLQAKVNLITAKARLQDAETTFFRVTGYDPGTLTTPQSVDSLLPESEAKAISCAIKSHPALKSANSDIKEAVAKHHHVATRLLPVVNLVASASYGENLDGTAGIQQDQRVMLEARWNLLNGGADINNKRASAIQVQEAAQIRNNTYRGIIENTRLNWVAYEANTAMLANTKKHMLANRMTIDAYAKQFQLGQRTLLDLLNAENEFFAAKNVYLNTRYDILMSQYSLLAATGRLPELLQLQLANAASLTKEELDFHNYPTSTMIERKAILSSSPNKVHANAKYTIQLIALSNLPAAKKYLKQHNLQGKAIISKTLKQNQRDHWYLVLYGNYPSVQAAKADLAKLKSELLCHQPWINHLT